MQQTVSLPTPPATPLLDRWKALLADEPRLRVRDAAARLAVSEMELLALGHEETVTRLAGDPGDIIRRLPELGRVMALTRNESAVHERKGTYGNIRIGKAMGLVLNQEIDLRLFMQRWAHAFAVEKQDAERPLRSLQFFDAAGTAIHKVYLTEASDLARYDELRRAFRHDDPSPPPVAALDDSPAPARPDREVDVATLRREWSELQDVHDFLALLRRNEVRRLQAFRLIGTDFAERVAEGCLWGVLNAVAGTGLPIMVFVGNPGCIQIHSGPVGTIKRLGPWANVLDPDFNLHLREDHIVEAWVVRKPTVDGIVTSLEIYDAVGDAIATLFSKRAEGEAEKQVWRDLLAALPRR